MKYNYTPRYKKYAKKVAQGLVLFKKTHKILKNPLNGLSDLALKKTSEMDTRRKSVGKVRDREQFYHPKLKRWVKRDRSTKRILKVRSVKYIPYKNIEKV